MIALPGTDLVRVLIHILVKDKTCSCKTLFLLAYG